MDPKSLLPHFDRMTDHVDRSVDDSWPNVEGAVSAATREDVDAILSGAPAAPDPGQGSLAI
jgi:hypothetical protein